jgi:methionine-rich copper-binding protein CopC
MTKHLLRWALLFALAFTPSAADAHAFLNQATPPVGSTLSVSPPEVRLQFSEPLEPRFSRLAVVDARGQDVTSGQVQINGVTMAVPLRPLSSGTYEVRWHALSVDTHATEGSYRFTVTR